MSTLSVSEAAAEKKQLDTEAQMKGYVKVKNM